MRALAPSPRLSATPQRVAARSRSWTTPRHLRVRLALGWLLVLLLVLLTVVGVRQMRAALTTIGEDAAPNVFTAQLIRATLSDLDANAATDLLAAPKGSRVARDAYEGDRTFLSHRLLDAAAHTPPGSAERKTLDTIADDLITYQETVARARDASQQSSADGAYLFQQATDLLHNEMLPAADALTASNATTVERVYRDHKRLVAAVAALLVTGGVALLLLLVNTQTYLAMRMRRVLNLPLLLATVLLIALAAQLATAVTATERDLRIAKEDAYNSLAVLTRAHAAAADARGDESLTLLDRANATRYEASFAEKTRLIADQPITATVIDAATRGDIRFGGYLADELRNTTFPAERETALDTLRAFGQYQAVHARITQLMAAGKYADAAALTTGAQEDQAGGVFDTFDRALSRVVYINQTAFDAAIARSARGLRYEDLLAVGAAVLLAGLIGLGVQLRLREYAG